MLLALRENQSSLEVKISFPNKKFDFLAIRLYVLCLIWMQWKIVIINYN
jgi:hypothetical protein